MSMILGQSVHHAHGRGVQNIMGGELGFCSQPGTAMTGFTRDGRCADVGPADAGAHHVCIQMKSDFCTVTGQPNWCTTREFPCMGQRGMCSIGNWCVCQWAFARYLAKAGGCDAIVDLVCNATHAAAFDAYSKSKRADDIAALECIKKKCAFPQGAEERSVPKIVDNRGIESVDKTLRTTVMEKNTTCSDDASNDSASCKFA